MDSNSFEQRYASPDYQKQNHSASEISRFNNTGQNGQRLNSANTDQYNNQKKNYTNHNRRNADNFSRQQKNFNTNQNESNHHKDSAFQEEFIEEDILDNDNMIAESNNFTATMEDGFKSSGYNNQQQNSQGKNLDSNFSQTKRSGGNRQGGDEKNTSLPKIRQSNIFGTSKDKDPRNSSLYATSKELQESLVNNKKSHNANTQSRAGFTPQEMLVEATLSKTCNNEELFESSNSKFPYRKEELPG